MKRTKSVLYIGTLLCLASLVYVISTLLGLGNLQDSDILSEDNRLRGLSYEIVIDLFGSPDSQNVFLLAWEDEPHVWFGRMQNMFPLMEPRDTVEIMVLHWEEGDGWQRLLHLHQQDGVWRVFHSFEWPPNMIVG